MNHNIHFNKENLVILLNEIINRIKNDNISIEEQQDLWDYLSGNYKIDAETLKCLFTGWWIQQHYNNRL